jgi:ATPase subunit of ABC transporter with duplicated ATPase domains
MRVRRSAARTMATPVLLEATDLHLRRAQRDLLQGVSLTLRDGDRAALVGANGSGKSTLLAVLASALAPDDGSVRRAPGVLVATLAQDPRAPAGLTLAGFAETALGPLRALNADLERAVAGDPERYLELLTLFDARGGFGAEATLAAALSRLGLDEDALRRPADSCSGGERRRAALAGVLASGAEVLLLDEPTNHLDLAAREYLADALLAHRGAVVLASHDRALMDRVATHVWRLAEGRIEVRRGGYTRVEQSRASEARARSRADRERRRRDARLSRMAEELARHGHRTAHTRRRRAERERVALRPAVDALEALDADVESATTLPVTAGRVRGELLRAQHLRAEGVIADASLRLERGDRVALVGPSGSGKTTVLELVTGARTSDDPRAELRWADGVRVVELDQHGRGLGDATTPSGALEAFVSRARAAAVLALVGLAPETWDRPAAELSGGERARAGLALLVVREADLLVLDEPTNDLDLPLIETLEATLVASDAAMIVASHDERLITALEAEVWALEAGELVRYRGGIEGYRRGARRLEPDIVAAEPATRDAGRAGGRAAAGEARVDRAPSVDDDDALARLEADLARAEAALLDPSRLSERERTRWLGRRRDAEERYLEAWERRLPPPEPRFRTRESGCVVWADREGDGLRVWMPGGPALRARRFGDVAHLVLVREEDRSVVPWAERALCQAAGRLACYTLPVRAVQVATPLDLGSLFEPLAPGWWVLRRAALERREGWRRRRRVG